MERIRLFDEIPTIEGGGLVLSALTDADAPALQELMDTPLVYRYLPTYLFEQHHGDAHEVIRLVYQEPFERRENLFLAVRLAETGEFSGILELYGYRSEVSKVSMGYRLLPRYWGRGITTEAVRLTLRYLYHRTDIELITASTMLENRASARVLDKCGFVRTAVADEDWGFAELTPTDKWFA